jgi:predicted MFS family arabinose efflux permease
MAVPYLLLVLLGGANFTIGMGALGVIGMLGPLGEEFALTPGEAGWVVTVYALVFAVCSPLLVALTGRLERVQVVTGGLVLFSAAGAAATLVEGYTPLLAARVLMALGSCLVGPVTTACAVALVPAEARTRALAITVGGVTLSQALGVPVSAWLAYEFGWRAGFWANAALGLAVAVALWWRLPRALAVPRSSLATLGQVLRSPRLLLALSYTLLFMGGAMTLYVYLPQVVAARYGASGATVGGALLMFGLGAILGNALGGLLTARLGPVRLLALLTVVLSGFILAVALLPLPIWALFPLLVLWSSSGWAFMVPQQARLAMLAPPLAPVLFALNASFIYVASSIGAALGGLVLRGAGTEALGPAAAVLVLAAAGTLAVIPRR